MVGVRVLFTNLDYVTTITSQRCRSQPQPSGVRRCIWRELRYNASEAIYEVLSEQRIRFQWFPALLLHINALDGLLR
jgi:hypothetical protein